MTDIENRDYDVALSFAGEERDYVERVAKELSSAGLRVFYDDDEKVDMWGNNLHDYLWEVYSKKADYCVIFVSEAYSRKAWTQHERRSAQSRAIRDRREYILPARFDETELPGLQDVSYIELWQYSPLEFAELVLKKLKESDLDGLKKKLVNHVSKFERFNFEIDHGDIEILEVLDDSRFRYRAITKIAQDVELTVEETREKLDYLREKKLVDLVDRPNNLKKWILTKNGKDFIEFHYHELDEGSGSGVG